MIEVNYNEYKETIAENMKLIIENHDLKEKINKAIEYIKYWTQDDGIILSWENVIKILEGEEIDE